MNELTQTFVQGAVSILVVLVGLAFKELKSFLETKAEHIKTKTDIKQYELIKSIAKTVVQATEQIYKDVKDANEEKFNEAEQRLTAELAKNGIHLSFEDKKLLIESVINGMNEIKAIKY